MKQDVKELWVAALRSGEYLQGDGALRRTRSDGSMEYCCLGVLCELAYAANAVERHEADEDGAWSYGASHSDAYLPEEVRVWSDILGSDPMVVFREENILASALNDDEGQTFDVIADCIEASL